RRPRPEQDEDRAQRYEEKIARQDEDDREQSQQPEAAQPFSANMLGRRFAVHGRPARAASTGRPAQPGGTTSSSVPAGTQPVSPFASFTRLKPDSSSSIPTVVPSWISKRLTLLSAGPSRAGTACATTTARRIARSRPATAPPTTSADSNAPPRQIAA